MPTLASVPGPFLLITLANFFFFLNFASFFLFPLQVRALGGSEAVVGMVMGTAGMAGLIVLPAVGIAVDRFDRRRFLTVGAGTMTIAALGFLAVDRIGVPLYGLRALQGVSFAMAFTASTALAAELAPADRRARALGLFGLSTIVTHAIAPTLGEEIVGRGGFHALFAVAALCSTVSVGLTMRLPPPPSTALFGTPKTPWRVGRLQWVLAATMALCGLGFGAVITFVPTFVHDQGFGRVGFFFLSYTTAAILTRLGGAGLSDRFGRRAVVLPTLVVLASSIFCLSTVHSVVTLVLTAIVFGLAQGISYPTLHAFLVDLTADEHLGRAQALFNGAFNLGVTGSGFVFGIIAEHFGHREMFVFAAGAPLLAWALLYGLGAAREPVARATPGVETGVG
jgi:MFS family permease